MFTDIGSGDDDMPKTPPSGVRGVMTSIGSQRAKRGKKVVIFFDPILRKFYPSKKKGEKVDTFGRKIVFNVETVWADKYKI